MRVIRATGCHGWERMYQGVKFHVNNDSTFLFQWGFEIDKIAYSYLEH